MATGLNSSLGDDGPPPQVGLYWQPSGTLPNTSKTFLDDDHGDSGGLRWVCLDDLPKNLLSQAAPARRLEALAPLGLTHHNALTINLSAVFAEEELFQRFCDLVQRTGEPPERWSMEERWATLRLLSLWEEHPDSLLQDTGGEDPVVQRLLQRVAQATATTDLASDPAATARQILRHATPVRFQRA